MNGLLIQQHPSIWPLIRVSDFTIYDEPIEIFLGDNTIIYAEGEGNVHISTYSSIIVHPIL